MNAQKSTGDLSGKAIFFDAGLMGAGYLLMGLYTVLVLGSISWTGLKVYLTLAGLFSVLLGLVVGLGLSSALGFQVTPLHTILPFLCLGIGIDDMSSACINGFLIRGLKLNNFSSGKKILVKL